MVILAVVLEVLGKFAYASGEDGDLDLRRPCVVVGTPKIGDDLGFCLRLGSHSKLDKGYHRPSARLQRRTGWPSSTIVAGRSFPFNRPFGMTVTSPTAVLDPSAEWSGQTKFPRPQKMGLPL